MGFSAPRGKEQRERESWTWMLETFGCEQHFDLGKALAPGCVLLSCAVLCWGCLLCSMCSALIPESRWPVVNGTKMNIVMFLSIGTDPQKGGRFMLG